MSRRRSQAGPWLAIAGLWFVGLGLYFIVGRPALLPEDLRYLGAEAVLLAALPRVHAWLRWVFCVLGGFMIATGVLTCMVAGLMEPGRRRYGLALLAAGVPSAGLMAGVNFALGSDFRWLLLLPVALWCAALLRYATEA